MVQRAMAKSSTQYNNTGWDLGDAKKAGAINVGTSE
jgi:hypothetical protein